MPCRSGSASSLSSERRDTCRHCGGPLSRLSEGSLSQSPNSAQPVARRDLKSDIHPVGPLASGSSCRVLARILSGVLACMPAGILPTGVSNGDRAFLPAPHPPWQRPCPQPPVTTAPVTCMPARRQRPGRCMPASDGTSSWWQAGQARAAFRNWAILAPSSSGDTGRHRSLRASSMRSSGTTPGARVSKSMRTASSSNSG